MSMTDVVSVDIDGATDADIRLPDGKSIYITLTHDGSVVVQVFHSDGSERGEPLRIRMEAEVLVDIEDEVDGMVDPTDRWVCWDASGVRVSYTDEGSAEEAAFVYVYDGDYAMPGIGEWTLFIEVQVAETADGPDARGVTIHVPLYPGSPPCWDGLDAIDPDYVPDDDGHKWSRVSTSGDGAGTFITEQCDWCGLLKDTRTRPQCPDCGETLPTEAIRYRREEE
jgi:hypothetical protein